MLVTFFAAIGLVSVFIGLAVGLVGLVGLFEFISATRTRLQWHGDRISDLQDQIFELSREVRAARKEKTDDQV